MLLFNKMIKVILFDFDGTLVDTFPLIKGVVEKFKKKEGYPPLDIEQIKQVGLKKLIKKSGIPLWKIPSITSKILKSFRKRTDIKLFWGIKKVIKELKKDYRLGILSSNSKENIKKILKENGVEKIFEYSYSDSPFFGKHNRLKKLIKKYKFNPEEIIYVGDEDRDIKAAKKVKIKSVAVTWGYNSRERLIKEKPTYLVDSPKELGKILKGKIFSQKAI